MAYFSGDKIICFPQEQVSGGGEREWPLQGPGRPHTIVGVIISPAAGPPSASGRPSVSHIDFVHWNQRRG